MLSGKGFEFWVVLCTARYWIQFFWVPSNSVRSMNVRGTDVFGKQSFEAVTVELKLNIESRHLPLNSDLGGQHLSSISLFKVFRGNGFKLEEGRFRF